MADRTCVVAQHGSPPGVAAPLLPVRRCENPGRVQAAICIWLRIYRG